MAKISPMIVLPPVIFAAIAGLLLGGMYFGHSDTLPSNLIGRDAPAVPQEGLPERAPLTDADLRDGKVTIVNYWASWCAPCRAEHPVLKDLAAKGYRVAGINFRDTAANADGYLNKQGDPFFALGFDPRGRTSVDWGVTAPPETFIVDGSGKVLFRVVGPLIGANYDQLFLPALQAATGQ